MAAAVELHRVLKFVEREDLIDEAGDVEMAQDIGAIGSIIGSVGAEAGENGDFFPIELHEGELEQVVDLIVGKECFLDTNVYIHFAMSYFAVMFTDRN